MSALRRSCAHPQTATRFSGLRRVRNQRHAVRETQPQCHPRRHAGRGHQPRAPRHGGESIGSGEDGYRIHRLTDQAIILDCCDAHSTSEMGHRPLSRPFASSVCSSFNNGRLAAPQYPPASCQRTKPTSPDVTRPWDSAFRRGS
jgi:hypothetical protein